MKFIKRCIKKILKIFGFKISKITADNYVQNYGTWESNSEFMQVFNEVKNIVSVSIDGCFMLWLLAKCVSSKEGDIAEVGVYEGGTSKIIAKSCPNKKIHLFDTFLGMPDINKDIDLHKKGDFGNGSVDIVRRFLTDCDNVIFHAGLFPKTAKGLESTIFCFVHIDADLYASIRDCLNFFYDKMTTGGIMVFHDWEDVLCPGVKRAINEFFKNKKEKVIITAANQCAVIKL